MTHQFEVYKCMHCGNIVEVVHGGGAPLVCCGENMKHMTEGTSDGAKEKHVRNQGISNRRKSQQREEK